MKMKLNPVEKLQAALLASLVVAIAPLSQAAPPLPPSPVFSNSVPAWDIIMTGDKGERGIALITFSYNRDDYGYYTFDMRQIHTKVPTTAALAKGPVTITNLPASSGRGVDSGRGDSTSAPIITPVASPIVIPKDLSAGAKGSTNIYGYLELSASKTNQGSWGYDYKGRVLGFYVEYVLDKPGEGTNPPSYLTNQVSFIGKATPNKRFTALYSSSIGGNGKFAGVPLTPVTNKVNGSDFSGPWTGEEIVGSRDMVELYYLLPSGFPNAYDIIGEGPGYKLDHNGTNVSVCLISSQKKIAFANWKFVNATNSTDFYRRATYGDLKNTSQVLGSSTKGLLQNGVSGSGSNVLYKADFVPYAPYP